jgi:hypothetical protein
LWLLLLLLLLLLLFSSSRLLALAGMRRVQLLFVVVLQLPSLLS